MRNRISSTLAVLVQIILGVGPCGPSSRCAPAEDLPPAGRMFLTTLGPGPSPSDPLEYLVSWIDLPADDAQLEPTFVPLGQRVANSAGVCSPSRDWLALTAGIRRPSGALDEIRVHVVDTQRLHAYPLARNPSPGATAHDLAWSPDGEALLFPIEYVRQGDMGDMFQSVLVHAQLKTRRTLSITDDFPMNRSAMAPSFRSDGKQIAFLVRVENWEADSEQERFSYELWVSAPNGKERRPLASHLLSFSDATDPFAVDIGRTLWSPDSKDILFYVPPTLYVIPAVGGTPLEIPHRVDPTSIAWLHDGRVLARGMYGVSSTADLVLINLREGTIAPLTETPGIDELAPTLSPDGGWIAYIRPTHTLVLQRLVDGFTVTRQVELEGGRRIVAIQW